MRPALKIFQHSFLLVPLGMVYLILILASIDKNEDSLFVGTISALFGMIVCGVVSFFSSLVIFVPIYHYEQHVARVRSSRQLFKAYLPTATLIMVIFSALVVVANEFDYPSFMVSFLGAAYLTAGTELFLFSKYLSKIPKHTIR